MMKRAVDVLVALVSLLVLAPVMCLVALEVYRDGGFPVLFRQVRMGRDGKTFHMYKFRSMVVNFDKRGAYFTSQNDPRITSVGRVIRRTSLDELPQLINVLRGDMSLVGPRPDVPAQRDLYTDADWALRCSVRPGITGLAQALYRSDATQAQRLAADLRYAREASLWLDVKISWLTLSRLAGRGSN